MALLTLGVSYRRAPVELLERLAFAEEDLPKAYHHLRGSPDVRGAVIVSTCNRVEVHADVEGYHAGFRALKAFLAEGRDVPVEEVDEPLYSHYEEQAVEHLLSVASGIDSMVLGEPQILSQVRRALRLAEDEGATTPELVQLFRAAARAGRRARAETAIGASPSALVEAGAALAAEALGGLAGRSLVLVGAGGMSEVAARALAGHGLGRVTVLNRTADRAERLAGRTGGVAAPLSRLGQALEGADLVVSSTGASGVVIDRPAVERAIAARAPRGATTTLFLLDLAVPRDVDPAVAGLPGVRLVDIDDLRAPVAREDRDAVEAVRGIVAEEVVRFSAWRRSARLAPLIAALHDKGERIRSAELRRAGGRLGSLEPEERRAVDALTRAIVAKLLHDPVTSAKAGTDPDEARARALADLFGLEPPAGR